MLYRRLLDKMKRKGMAHGKIDWSAIIMRVRRFPAHYEIKIPRGAVIDPLKAGFRIDRYAIPKGEIRNYRICMKNGRSIHVREYSDYYAIHWDRFDPKRSLMKHLIFDLPAIPIVLSSIFLIFLFRFIPGKGRLLRG